MHLGLQQQAVGREAAFSGVLLDPLQSFLSAFHGPPKKSVDKRDALRIVWTHGCGMSTNGEHPWKNKLRNFSRH